MGKSKNVRKEIDSNAEKIAAEVTRGNDVLITHTKEGILIKSLAVKKIK